MKERRHVTIDKKIGEKIEQHKKKIEKIFLKFPEDSPKYQKAKKLEKELDNLEELIKYIKRVEKEDYVVLSQLEGDCRFYDVRLVTLSEMKKKLQQERRKKDNYDFPLCWNLKKRKEFDTKAYVNVFEFFIEHDYENDFCLKRIEELLY